MYRLVDVARGRTKWQRLQQEREGSPVELCISDDGLVVVRAHSMSWSDESLLVFDHEGRKRLAVTVTHGEGALEAARDEHLCRSVIWRDPHVDVTTAGPDWVGASLRYFASVDRTPVFCWRPWWGRRILIDLEQMQLLDDDATAALVPALAGGERDVAARSLAEEHVGAVQRGDAGHLVKRQELGALLAAGEHHLRGAIPPARLLEHTPSSSRVHCDALGHGWVYGLRRTRAIARRTLRMLGEEPSSGGNVDLLRELSIATHEPASAHGVHAAPGPTTPSPPDAHALASTLTAGASAIDLLARAGTPDWIGRASAPRAGEAHFRRELWEYDGPDTTTRITWSAPNDRSREAFDAPRVIDTVETIAPRWCAEDRLADYVAR